MLQLFNYESLAISKYNLFASELASRLAGPFVTCLSSETEVSLRHSLAQTSTCYTNYILEIY